MTNWANMHQGITTIALYDTLGADAMKYVCNQTQIKTIFCSKAYIELIAKLKQDDSSCGEPRLHRIEALVCYDDDVDESAVESCK